jgi:[protein-PII] uridylyltransferase
MSLLTGGTEFRRASDQARNELRDLARELAPRRITDEELDAHFALLPPRYYEIHTPAQIVDDLELTHRFIHRLILENSRALAPVTAWIDERDRGYNLVKVCTWDRAGLFWKIAGSLSAAGLNILGAQIFSRADGIALDTFFVNDARTGNLAEKEQREKFSDLLELVLTGETVDFPALITKQTAARSTYSAYLGEQLETQIRFDNETSDERTVIEIETEDRLGLLYTISQTLAELNLDISAARIVTERGAAIDNFYVRDADDGHKITSTERLKQISTALKEAIGRLEAFP